MKWCGRISIGTFFLAGISLIAVQALVLFAMGRAPICACGYVKLWGGIAAGPEISQQIADWYTYTHLIHGIGFYFVLWLIAPRMPVAVRFVIALAFEASWEIFENTSFVIDRYRQSAIAQGYFGDSIVNSVADTVAAALGFVLARTLPVWSIVVLAVTVELSMAYMIRDNLTLNIIQLIHPLEAIARWQAGG